MEDAGKVYDTLVLDDCNKSLSVDLSYYKGIVYNEKNFRLALDGIRIQTIICIGDLVNYINRDFDYEEYLNVNKDIERSRKGIRREILAWAHWLMSGRFEKRIFFARQHKYQSFDHLKYKQIRRLNENTKIDLWSKWLLDVYLFSDRIFRDAGKKLY